MMARERLCANLADELARIERRYFAPGAKLTLVVRRPDDDEADIVTTSDDLREAVGALNRTIERERNACEHPESASLTTEQGRLCGRCVRIVAPPTAPPLVTSCMRCGVAKRDHGADFLTCGPLLPAFTPCECARCGAWCATGPCESCGTEGRR